MQVLILEQEAGQYSELVNKLSVELPVLRAMSVHCLEELTRLLDGPSFEFAVVDQHLGWCDVRQAVHDIKSASPDCTAILLMDAEDEIMAARALDDGYDLYILRSSEVPRKLLYVLRTVVKARRKSVPPVPVTCSPVTDGAWALEEDGGTKEELFGSQQAFRALFDASPLAVVVMDPKLRVRLWNPAAEQMFGWSESEVVGLRYPLVPDDVLPEFQANIRRVLRGGSLVGEHFVRCRKDGSCIDVSVSASALTGPDGEVTGVMALIEDITERVRAEEKRQKEIERGNLLLSLYERAPGLTDKELYDFALNHAVYLTGSQIGFFHLVSEDQQAITLTTWNDEALKHCNANFDTHYPVAEAGNWVDCVRLGRPVVYNDFPTSPNRKGLPEGHVPLRRFMSIPVLEDGKVRVIFGVGNKSEDYDDRDVLHIQLVAHELQKIIERRHAENALRESERRFYAVFHNAPLYCTLLHALRDADGNLVDGVILDMSPLGITGLPMDLRSVLGKRASEVFGEEIIAPHLEMAARVTSTGESQQYEHYYEPTGQHLLSVTFVAGEDIYAVLSVDITERKTAEKQLHEIRSQLERLLSASGTMLYTCEAKGDYASTFVSDNVTRNMGYSVEEFLVPDFWVGNIHPDDLDRVLAIMSDLGAANDVRHEYRFRHKDGRWRWMEDEFTIVRDSDGIPVELVGYWRDVTERKSAEHALVASEAKYRQLHESLTDAFVAIDMTGRITDHNEVFLSMVGYTPEEIDRIAYSEVITEDWSSFNETVTAQVLRDGHSDLVEMECRRKDGSLFPVDLRMVLLRDQDGQPNGMWAIVRDITERKRAEEEMRASNTQLQALSRQLVTAQEAERRNIARELHDEMGATLTGLSIALEVASRQSAEEAAKRIQEAKALTADLMKRVQRMSVDLRSLIVDDMGLLPALNEYVGTYSSHTGIDVAFSYECSTTRLSPSYEICLFRVAQEALTNIARHAVVTEADLSLSSDSDSIVLCIEDKGRGFDVGRTIRDRSACGLIGMKERVLALGGTFNVESELGIGTRLEVRLPVSGAWEVR